MTQEFNPDKLRVVIGLGNPTKDYETTYHNMGAMFADYLAKHLSENSKFKSYARGGFRYAEVGKIAVVKPNGFMNESGRAFKKTLSFFKCSPENVLVAHDENDLYFGEYKIDFGKGAAGHKGITSIILAIKEKNFWRLRIGIQPKTTKRKKAGDFVLSKLSQEDAKKAEKLFGKIILDYFD